ncbi:hypothetical protein ACFY7C_36095 [Streptomyces sp. NPDC012769]|uniref:hypothetical protein n=1 Tax=Streptomyces sp. NPDC012769 TaxID=3364848 RepID=UPI0036993D91
MRPDPWASYDWVVWWITVDDPEAMISESYHSGGIGFLLAQDSRKVMADLAVALGCVYEGCKDDGTFGSDNDACYTWWFKVPQAEHANRSPRGWPVVVEECRKHLERTLHLGFHHWHGFVDERRTRATVTGEHVPALR